MSQYASLSRDLPFIHELMNGFQKISGVFRVIFYGVNTDYSVTGAIGEAFFHGGHNTVHIIGGVVRLVSVRHSAGKTNGGVAARRLTNFGGSGNEVQVGHKFRNGGNGFTGHAATEAKDFVATVRQDVLTEFTDRVPFEFVVDEFVYIIINNAGNFVLFVRNDRVFIDVFQGHAAQHESSCDSFRLRFSCNALPGITGFHFVRFGQNFGDGMKFECPVVHFCFQLHSLLSLTLLKLYLII